MPDQISKYRQLRLIVQVPRDGQDEAGWSVHALSVARGIPVARVIASGRTPYPVGPVSVEDLLLVLRECLED